MDILDEGFIKDQIDLEELRRIQQIQKKIDGK
jgi:hypothetical protein